MLSVEGPVATTPAERVRLCVALTIEVGQERDERRVKSWANEKRTQRMKYLITARAKKGGGPSLAVLVRTSLERTFCLYKKRKRVSLRRERRIQAKDVYNNLPHPTDPTHIQPSTIPSVPSSTPDEIYKGQQNVRWIASASILTMLSFS